MARNLSKLHYNEIVFLDRVELNILIPSINKRDERSKLLEKVLARVFAEELEKNNPCMNVPVRVWELKILYPDYETKPPRYCER